MHPLDGLRLIAWKLYSKVEIPFTRLVMKVGRLGEIDGIAICDCSAAQKTSQEFLLKTQEALTLIQTLDPRRYRRICKSFSYISNEELISMGEFKLRLKICRVDYTRCLTSSDTQWNLRTYARLLIHEATHALLFTRGIPYNKETWERCERLCHLEEYRFALHFEPGYADIHPGPFDAERWRLYWNEPARRDALRKRFKESLRSINWSGPKKTSSDQRRP